MNRFNFLCIWIYMGLAVHSFGSGWTYDNQRAWPGVCSSGRSQSPIPMSQPGVMPIRGDVTMQYEPANLKIVEEGHTVYLSLENSGFVKIPNVDTPFYLKQMNFHTPSEHYIGGVQFDMELHLVHENNNGEYLNIAVLCDFEEHPTTHWLDDYIYPFIMLQSKESIPGEHVEQPPPSEGYTVDVADFWDQAMRGLETYYSYEGSLAQPPCTEGVRWIVSGHICIASKQWQSVMGNFKAIDHNARQLQPVNGREIEIETTRSTFKRTSTTKSPTATFGTGGKSGSNDDGGGGGKLHAILPLCIFLMLVGCCAAAYLHYQQVQQKTVPDVSYHQYGEDITMDNTQPYTGDRSHHNKTSIGGGPFEDERHAAQFNDRGSYVGQQYDADQQYGGQPHFSRYKSNESFVYEPHMAGYDYDGYREDNPNGYREDNPNQLLRTKLTGTDTPSQNSNYSRGHDSMNSNESIHIGGSSTQAAYNSKRSRALKKNAKNPYEQSPSPQKHGFKGRASAASPYQNQSSPFRKQSRVLGTADRYDRHTSPFEKHSSRLSEPARHDRTHTNESYTGHRDRKNSKGAKQFSQPRYKRPQRTFYDER